MERRKFLKGAGLVAASAGLAAPAIAQTPSVKWRMATSWPKSLDTLYGSAAAMCERISQITDGKFQIQVFAGGEIVPPLQVFDAAANNTVECSHTLTSYFIGKNTAYAFDGGLPFGLNARQQASWLYYGGGMELLRTLFGKAGLVQVPVGNVGVQMGGWFRKEINSVEDLKGLKFRIGGLGGTVFSKLGVIPQQIAAADIYSSLERAPLMRPNGSARMTTRNSASSRSRNITTRPVGGKDRRRSPRWSTRARGKACRRNSGLPSKRLPTSR